MRSGALLLAAAALLVAAAAWAGLDLERLTAPSPAPPLEPAAAPPPAPDAGFDHYVLALSWSPTYCETEATDRDRLQCGSGRPFAFVAHGLWPEEIDGRDPEFCDAEARVPASLIDGMLDIMPAPGLIGHQWRKHGSCTGLSMADYFATLRRAYLSIDVPDAYERLSTFETVAPAEVIRRFALANPAIVRDGIAVTCRGNRLAEVRVCLSKTLEPIACPEMARRSCRRDSVVMPPVRGG